MDRHLGGKPGDETAGGIGSATGGDAPGDKRHILPPIDVERRGAPVASRLGRLFFHGDDPPLGVNLSDARLAEFGQIGLVVPHDAAGAFRAGIAQEATQAEREQVITGDDEHVLIDPAAVDGQLDVANGAKPRFIRRRAVVQNDDGRPVAVRPCLENGGKLMVRHNDISIHHTGTVDVIDQPVQDGLAPDIQQGLGKVFRQRIQPRRIASGQDHTFHTLQFKPTPSALSHRKKAYFPARCGKSCK